MEFVCRYVSRSRGPAIRCRFRLTCGRARTDHAHRHATAAAVSVRPIRGQAPGCIIRVPLRLHAAPSAGGRSLPERLRSLIGEVEAFGGQVTRIGQVLRTEYDTGVGIGWHRDKPHFDQIFGLSLGSECRFRFRRRAGEKWQRFTLQAAPRSIYMMAGPARHAWEHSIPAASKLRAIRLRFAPWSIKPETREPRQSSLLHPAPLAPSTSRRLPGSAEVDDLRPTALFHHCLGARNLASEQAAVVKGFANVLEFRLVGNHVKDDGADAFFREARSFAPISA